MVLIQIFFGILVLMFGWLWYSLHKMEERLRREMREMEKRLRESDEKLRKEMIERDERLRREMLEHFKKIDEHLRRIDALLMLIIKVHFEEIGKEAMEIMMGLKTERDVFSDIARNLADTFKDKIREVVREEIAKSKS